MTGSSDWFFRRNALSTVQTYEAISGCSDTGMTATLLAWWFLLWSPGGGNQPTIVGPFDSASGCESVRLWSVQATHVTSQPVAVSPCWSGPFNATHKPETAK
jgi:hypothetical protein